MIDPPVAGAKIVSIVPANAGLGLATHQAAVILLDPETGVLQAVIEARYLTEARTAAVSALSVRELARKDAGILAILGSGAQARSHLAVLPSVRTFHQIRVWSPAGAHLERFVREAGSAVVAARSAEDAVRDAGVIVLATSSGTPVIDRDWVSDGAHVISVGAPRPHQREIDPRLLQAARIFVDSKSAALSESGDIISALRDGLIEESAIAGELGHLLAGSVTGRQHGSEITLFKSLGLAVEDLTAARLVLTAYQQRK
jgi:ornithine cyclodeaminase/alanine dehydrogenase-like protein (mu-crystallin family)